MKVFEKLKNYANYTAAKIMTAPTEPVKESPKTHKAKKIILMGVTMAVMATLCTITVFADEPKLDGSAKQFFESALGVLKTVLILIGAGVGIWGIVNLLEGYGNDNPGAKSQGMKQLMAGIGVALVGVFAPDALKSLIA